MNNNQREHYLRPEKMHTVPEIQTLGKILYLLTTHTQLIFDNMHSCASANVQVKCTMDPKHKYIPPARPQICPFVCPHA